MLRIFFLMIAPDGALDAVFGWQAMLAKMYQSPKKSINMLGKALGDCHTCTAFWFMAIYFVMYFFASKLILHFYITDQVDNIAGKVFIAIFWYFLWHSIGAVMGILSLRRLANKSVK